MKKIFVALFMLALLCCTADFAFCSTTADTTTQKAAVQWNSESALKRVNTIGQKIMKANGLPDGITFKVSEEEEDVNAYANLNKEIYVYKGLLDYVGDDNELAAVIAHEMGHIINGHCAKQTIINSAISSVSTKIKPETEKGEQALSISQSLLSTKVSRSDETEADLTSVDLLVKAGYNPLSSVSVLNKICGNYFDILSTHPSGEKRLYSIYDYVDYNYSLYIKTGYNSESYTKALTLIKTNVAKREGNAKKLAKFKKEQEKLKTKKAKREAKMIKSGSNPWDTSLNALQLMAN